MTHNDPAYDLRKILEAMELELVKSLKRNLKRHEKEEEKEGFRWEMWQRAKLRNLRRYQKENRRIVGGISPEVERVVNEALETSYENGQNLFTRVFDRIKSLLFRRKRIGFPKNQSAKNLESPVLPEKQFFGLNEKKLRAMQKSVSDDVEKAEHAVLRRMDDVYRRTIYNAQVQLGAGAKTLDQAIDAAVHDFLQKGIDCIQYKNGRRVNIASYAEMALRTASHRAMLLGEGAKRDEWGIHTVVVSAHANTCPLCEPWQGKVLVDDVFSHGTKEEAESMGLPLLSEAIDAGLLHPNCRHTIATYFPGITRTPKIPDGKAAVEMYEIEQRQRGYERQIRRWKRIAAGCTDPQNVERANKKVQEYQKAITDLVNQHDNLRRNYRREKNYFEGGESGGM